MRDNGARIGVDKQDDYVRAVSFGLLEEPEVSPAVERLEPVLGDRRPCRSSVDLVSCEPVLREFDMRTAPRNGTVARVNRYPHTLKVAWMRAKMRHSSQFLAGALFTTEEPAIDALTPEECHASLIIQRQLAVRPANFCP